MYLLISKHLWTILVIVLGAGLQRQKTSSYSHEPYQLSERKVHRQKEPCVLSAAGDSAAAMTACGGGARARAGRVKNNFLGL